MKAIAGAIVLFAGSFYTLAIAWMATATDGKANFLNFDSVYKLITFFVFALLFHIFVGFYLIAFGKDQHKE